MHGMIIFHCNFGLNSFARGMQKINCYSAKDDEDLFLILKLDMVFCIWFNFKDVKKYGKQELEWRQVVVSKLQFSCIHMYLKDWISTFELKFLGCKKTIALIAKKKWKFYL